jgi:hypothetical protein
MASFDTAKKILQDGNALQNWRLRIKEGGSSARQASQTASFKGFS